MFPQRVSEPMDIFFCDICNESVPQTDLDRGMAFRRGERVVCAACDKAMSNELEDGAAEAEAFTPDPDALQPEGSTDTEGVPTEGAEGATAQEQLKQAPARTGVGLSGCLFGLLLFTLVISLALNALLWVEGERARSSLNASVAALEQGDAVFDARFRDLQTNLARQGQDKDAFVRDSLNSLEGSMNERLVNLGSRLGRSENAVESLRQSTTEDRRSLADDLKGATEAAGVASKTAEDAQAEMEYLTDRVVALEEVLEAGVASGADADSGRQPSWVSYLPELKDASAGNRWNAVTVLGDTGDARTIPYLLPMLKDEDVFVRMATARVLGDLESAAAIPGLVDALSDSQAAVREAAVVALRVISGKDFRFDPLGKEGDRVKAQGAWRKWWEENAEDLLGG